MTEEFIEEENVAESSPKKRKLYLGLDLGTLNSCILSKLSKVNSNDSEGILVPTIVGYPEELGSFTNGIGRAWTAPILIPCGALQVKPSR